MEGSGCPMNHEIMVDDAATLATRPGRVVLDLAGSVPGPVCLGLALVRENLVDGLLCRTGAGDWVVRVGRSADPRAIGFRWYEQNRFEVVLGDQELQRWLSFFLRYHRDGVPEVDHLEVAGTLDAGESCQLVLLIGNAAPPFAGEERFRKAI